MRQFVLICVAAALLVGCSPNAGSSTPKLDPNSAEARGSALFSGKGRCTTCHSLSPDVTIVGPSLAGVATRAEKREPPLTAAEFLEESILDPDKVKAPGFEQLQMDISLAKTLTTDEIADLVAYMLTLK